MKKFALILALLLVLIGCGGEDPAFTASEEIDNVITGYIVENLAHESRGGASFAAQEYYGGDRQDGKILVYMWTYYQEYYVENAELRKGSGASLPLVITLKEVNEGYTVVGHQVPRDGSEYGPSIKEIFPEKYHDQIFSRRNVRDLEKTVLKRALAHFHTYGFN